MVMQKIVLIVEDVLGFFCGAIIFNFFFFYEMFGCMGIWIKYSLRRIEVLVRERDSVYCLKIQLFSLVFDIQIFINKFIMLSICFFEYIVILIECRNLFLSY